MIVLVRIAIAVMQHHDQKQLVEERVYSTQFHITSHNQNQLCQELKWGRNLGTEADVKDREMLTDLCPMAISADFLQNPGLAAQW